MIGGNDFDRLDSHRCVFGNRQRMIGRNGIIIDWIDGNREALQDHFHYRSVAGRTVRCR